MKSYMIPVLPKPMIPAEPRAPELVAQLPPSIVTTAEEVSYWDEACGAWQGGEYTKAEMAEEYPGLSMAASCECYLRTFRSGTSEPGIHFYQTGDLR